MEIFDVKKFLRANNKYLSYGQSKLAKKLNITDIAICKQAIIEIKQEQKDFRQSQLIPTTSKLLQKYIDTGQFDKAISILSETANTSTELGSIVLVIGDLHAPFTHKDYLEFCRQQYVKFGCNKVVFIGDIIDNHFASFHPTDPDGYGAGEELERSIAIIQDWYRTFPKATVIIGNHDRLSYRKAFAGGISKKWIREYCDVLGTPGWDFTESCIIDNVLYIHGEGGTARTKCKDVGMSVIQGHLHSQAYIEWISNRKFAAQVGTGIDSDSYAFGYAKAGKESILSCLTVFYGKQPYLCKM